MSVVRCKDKNGNIQVLEKLRVMSKEMWKPHPDWFDIEKILEEDKEEYIGKVICLLKDDEDVCKINRMGEIGRAHV